MAGTAAATQQLQRATRSSKPLLKDQVILVTGGSRGIGRAIVKELSGQGANVLFTYAARREDAESVVNSLGQGDGEVVSVQADVKDFKRSQQLITETIERFGRIDGLVNCAGILRDKALMLMDPADWSEVLETNLTGVFNLCRAVIVGFMK